MSVLVSTVPDRYNARRHLKKSDVNPIDPRWFFVISLHMAGTKVAQIMEMTGYSDSTIYSILSDPRAIQIRQQILKNTQMEFEALFSKVVAAVEAGLDSPKAEIQLNAAQIWLRAHGKFTQDKEDDGSGKLTAEDVVKHIMNQQINIQVNVGGKDGNPSGT